MASKKAKGTTKKDGPVTRAEFDELKELMKKTLVYNEAVLAEIQGIKKTLFWARVASIAKIVIIVLPFILAYLYLVPFFEGQYKELYESFNELRL